MTNRLALGLVLALIALYGLSTLVLDHPMVAVGRRFVDLIQWLAFWR